MAFLRKIAPPSSLAASVEIGKNVIIDLKVRLKVVKSQPTGEQPLPAAVSERCVHEATRSFAGKSQW
jgi:hypothetical protein